MRIEIGFEGGQIMSAHVDAAAADAIERALDGGRDQALAFEAEDGRYTVVASRILYFKRFSRESRVGFGG